MNFFGSLFTILIAAVIGFFLYPVLIESTEPKVESRVESVTIRFNGDKITLNVDPDNIAESEYPETVKVVKPIKLADDSEETLILEKGATAKLLSFDGEKVEIQAQIGEYKGKVPYDNTDFISKVAEKKIQLKVATDQPVTTEPEKAVAAQQPKEMPKPEAVEQVKQPKKDYGPLAKKISNEEVVALMKDSLAKKEVSAFSAEEVTNWDTLPETEYVNEVEYQVGTATYQKETIFGKSAISAKALIRNGKIYKWVHAKTGVDLQ